MKCPSEHHEQSEALLAYLAGERGTPAAAAMRQHLEACAACRQWVEDQQKVWAALDEWEAPSASANFDQRLYARIEQEVSWWDRCLRVFRPLSIKVAIPVAAAACLTLALVMLNTPVPSPPRPATPVVEIQQPEQVEHALDDMQLMQEFNETLRKDGRSEM